MSEWFISPAEARARRASASGSAVATADPIRKPALSQLHSEPSNDAARRIEPARETLRAKVLEAIRDAGPIDTTVRYAKVSASLPVDGLRMEDIRAAQDVLARTAPTFVSGGLTDEQGIEATSIAASTYRPRRVELVEAGLIQDSGLTRPTRSGRKATVWVAR